MPKTNYWSKGLYLFICKNTFTIVVFKKLHLTTEGKVRHQTITEQCNYSVQIICQKSQTGPLKFRLNKSNSTYKKQNNEVQFTNILMRKVKDLYYYYNNLSSSLI